MSRKAIVAATACLLFAGCGSGVDEAELGREELLEPVPGVVEILLRTNSGLPNFPTAPLASEVFGGTNSAPALTAGVPFVVMLRLAPGNLFLETDLDAHEEPDTDVGNPQDGRDRGGGNERTVALRFDVQLGPDSNLPGTGVVPFSQLPEFDGSNERLILDRARQIGIPIEDIAIPTGFNLSVFLNRNILTSTEAGLVSPDGRQQNFQILMAWKPSPNQLLAPTTIGRTVTLDASVRYEDSPLGVRSESFTVVGAQGGNLVLRLREGSSLPKLAGAPSAAAVRSDVPEVASITAGLPYVLELEVVPGSAGFDLHVDPERTSAGQNGLDRGGGNEAQVSLVADRDLGPAENLPAFGLPPYSTLPAFDGSNERAIFAAARAAGIDPLTVSLPAGFNLAIFLNRNVFTSDFSGAYSADSRADLVVVLASFQSGLGAAATAALAGDIISFDASVTDRAGNVATSRAQLAVTAPVPPSLDFSVRTEGARPDLADAPPASEVLLETSPLTMVGTGVPFNLFLQVTPGSTGIDFHRDPELVTSTPPQNGLARGGGNEMRLSITADRQLGNAARLPGAGAPPYDQLPFYSGANERAIFDAAITLGIDPTTIALPPGFNLALFYNRNVLTSDAAGDPSPDSRNPATTFLSSYQVDVFQAADPALLGDTITFTVTVEDALGSIGMATTSVQVVPATPPTVTLRLLDDSGLADLADAPTTDVVDGAAMDLGGTLAAGTAFTFLVDVTPGSGRVDAHTDPELSVETPPQSGLVRGGGNEVTVQLFCDRQLGPAANLPGTGMAPFDALPAYNGSNERAIIESAIAMGIDPTTVALPAGFNLAVLLNRNILTTDAMGVPSPDSRVPTSAFTLGYGASALQGLDAMLSGMDATFTVVVTDQLGGMGTDSEVVTVP